MPDVWFTNLNKLELIYENEKTLLREPQAKIDYIRINTKIKNFKFIRISFIRRRFHLQYLQNVEIKFDQNSKFYSKFWSLVKFCPILKFIKTPLAVLLDNEKTFTLFYLYMAQQSKEMVNIFFNGRYIIHEEDLRVKRICYLISMAARRCFNVCYLYGTRFISKIMFKFAMTSVDFMNRKFKNICKGVFLGSSLNTHHAKFHELKKIFPEISIMTHPGGNDLNYRRDGKLIRR